MSLVLFNEVNSKIEILQDEHDQPWIHRAKYGRYLRLEHIHTSLPKNMKHEQRTREQLMGCRPSAPLDRTKNKTDIFLSLDAALYIAMRCDKDEAKPVRK